MNDYDKLLVISGFIPLLDNIQVSHCDVCEELHYSLVKYLNVHYASSRSALTSYEDLHPKPIYHPRERRRRSDAK